MLNGQSRRSYVIWQELIPPFLILEFSGDYKNMNLPWLRWWDAAGNLLLTGAERAETAEQRAETAEQRAERLAAQLRALGIEPAV